MFLAQALHFSPVSNVSCNPTVIDDIPEFYVMMRLSKLRCISVEFSAHSIIYIFMFPCRPNEDFLMAVRHFPMLYYMVGTINR